MSKDEIAELRAELAELKKMVNPPSISDAEVRQHMADAHRMREARMANASAFSAEDLRAMAAACPDNVARDIVRRGGIPGPSAAGAGGTISSVPARPGLPGHGWREAPAIGPVPGLAALDRVALAAEARDRHDLIVEDARRKAEMKLAGRE
jgi:cell division septum initiation protein DivIVA